jgi:signal transduction histidine kinase
MKSGLHQATAELDIGFFTFDPAHQRVQWVEPTLQRFGVRGPGMADELGRRLRTGLRSHVLRGLSEQPTERYRCIMPIGSKVSEVVFLPRGEEAENGQREGFFFPFPLHESLDTMRRHFLSNISNKLRSLLNSVIIASDVIAAAAQDQIQDHGKFLGLMAEDAREVNTLLNKLAEVISYTSPSLVILDDRVDVRSVLADVHTGLQFLAEDASIKLTLAVPDTLPPARGSHLQLLLVFFLAVHHALSRTDPLGEIMITVGASGALTVEIIYANGEIPPNLAVSPEAHGLVPVVPAGWSDSAGLQSIDALLGLVGMNLTPLGSGTGLGLLKLPLPVA